MSKITGLFLVGISFVFFGQDNVVACYEEQQVIEIFEPEEERCQLIDPEEFARKEEIAIFKGKLEELLRIRPEYIGEFIFLINRLDKIRNNLEKNAELLREEDPEFSDLYWKACEKIEMRIKILKEKLKIKIEDKRRIQNFLLENIGVK